MQTTIKKEVKEEVLQNGDIKLIYDEVHGGWINVSLLFSEILFFFLGAVGLVSSEFLLSIPLFLIGAALFYMQKSYVENHKNQSFTITPDTGIRFNSGKDYAKFDDVSFATCNRGSYYSALCISIGGTEVSITGALTPSSAQELFRLFKFHSQRDWD